jgi:hypothetical protein
MAREGAQHLSGLGLPDLNRAVGASGLPQPAAMSQPAIESLLQEQCLFQPPIDFVAQAEFSGFADLRKSVPASI